MGMSMGRMIGRRAVLAAAGFLAGAVALGSGDALAQAKVKVAGVYTVPIEQQWVGRIHKALKEAEGRGEIEYVWAESVAATDYERVLRQYAEGGQQLIVGEAFAVERPARAVAKDYPKTAFLMGSSFGPVANNFSVFDNYIQEPAYLTGMIAGAMSKSGIIGMVGGYPIPEVNRLMHAFMAGAKEVNPDVKFTVSFIGSWYQGIHRTPLHTYNNTYKQPPTHNQHKASHERGSNVDTTNTTNSAKSQTSTPTTVEALV